MRRRRPKPRRGIILLIVLSLLTLFTLLLVTFILVSGQYRQAAVSSASSSRRTLSPSTMLDSAAYILFRDTTDPSTPLRTHSLLYDLYGADGFIGEVASVGNIGTLAGVGDGTSRTFMELSVKVQAPNPLPPATAVTPGAPLDLAGNYFPLSFSTGYYNGCVLTAASGDSLGYSFRVVGYQAPPDTDFPNPTNHVFRVMAIPSAANGTPLRNQTTGVPLMQAGDKLVMNGRPFNGTGFGYDSSAAAADPKLDPTYALLPNRTAVEASLPAASVAASFAAYLSGDADESYDAVDFQNMPLAGIMPVSSAVSSDGLVVIPSFHRPALINYWYYTNGLTSFPAGAVMRPMPWDHPEFNGSNPALTLPRPWSSLTAAQQSAFIFKLTGRDPATSAWINPWDVDNDGDRIADSMWLDLGVPAQASADGRLVKPLFAILCVDLDGRLNLNAHGSTGQIAASVNPMTGQVFPLQPTTRTTILSRRAAATALPQGQGLGPAEINLGFSPTTPPTYPNSYPLFRNTNVMDEYATIMKNRYGADLQPGGSNMDPLAQVKLFEFPVNYFSASGSRSAYGSPPDIFGELSFGLDFRGQPTYDTPALSRTDVLSNSPYEFDLTGLQRGQSDAPYTVAELERLLRTHDLDASQLPDRLTTLVNVFTGNSATAMSKRRSVTTDSFSLPVPPVLSVPELRDDFAGSTNWLTDFVSYNQGRPLHITDLLAQRLLNAGLTATSVNAELAKMLPHELVAGTRLNINRPIGNAKDDDQNGVVDDHGPSYNVRREENADVDGLDNDSDGTVDEPSRDEIDYIWRGVWNNVTFDHDNDSATPNNRDAYLARHLLARHLYVLLATLKDVNFEFDLDGIESGADPGANIMDPDTAESLAQWAINVVDFRDADSIMTPFEYDPNPFNGWHVDGNIETDEGTDGVDSDGDGAVDEPDEKRGLVWGCERPELLIKETLAFHDRRTEDLNSAQGKTNKMQTSGNMQEDDAEAGTGPNDFDQRLRPRGSLFIELYNPWSGESARPAELYYDNSGNQRSGVVLNKRAPSAANTLSLPTTGGTALSGAPVWRMIVVGSASHGPPPLDPDDPLAGTGAPHFVPSHVERGIYFTAPTGLPANAAEPGHGLQRHYTTLPVAPLEPGRFAVVGSAGESDGAGNYITTIGRRKDAKDNGQKLSMTDLLTASTRRIVLTPNANPAAHQVQVFDNVNPDPTIPEIKPAIAIAMNNGINTGTGAARPLNLSISEPLNGYANVIGGAMWDGTLASGEGAYSPTMDTPLDDQALGRPMDIVSALAVDPVADSQDRNNFTGTVRTVHLQRLANPLVPYHATINPYRTIDTATIDLTVFEGVHDPDDLVETPLPMPRTNPAVAFGSRQRGSATIGAGAPTGRALWTSTDTYAARTTLQRPDADAQVFNYQLDHTLGFLNRLYGTRYSQADATSMTITTEFVGSPNAESGTGHPYPWLTWNNRPYISQYEMMLVPYSRSSRLMVDYSIIDPSGLPTVYDGTPQFGHLLNFFATNEVSGTSTNLYHLFDYTHVPSRFVGAETWLEPSVFASGNGTALFHPPFNKVPNFREPGKVNINTIFEERVWDGIRGANPTLPTYAEFINSRRGYDLPATFPSTPVVDTATGFHNDGTAAGISHVPTFFGNPYRASNAGDLVPLEAMQREGIESSLLRSNATLTLPIPASPTPIDIDTAAETDGLFAETTSGGAHVNPNRNPYFRYQNMQRLGNLVTTQSNVYAVWITMGFFEVDAETGQLGQEAGSDAGDVTRNRAFYVFDRSIPVAFEPGENHNVDRAILMRRFIE